MLIIYESRFCYCIAYFSHQMFSETHFSPLEIDNTWILSRLTFIWKVRMARPGYISFLSQQCFSPVNTNMTSIIFKYSWNDSMWRDAPNSSAETPTLQKPFAPVQCYCVLPFTFPPDMCVCVCVCVGNYACTCMCVFNHLWACVMWTSLPICFWADASVCALIAGLLGKLSDQESFNTSLLKMHH